MTSKDFVEQLKKSMPEVEKLKELQYSEEEILQIKSAYLLNESESDNKYPDLGELGWLFSKYAMKNLEIGMITFIQKPVCEKDDTYQIGNVEADELVFSTATGSVFVREAGRSHILWQCADSAENFISALEVMSRHFSQVMVNESLYDDFQYLEQVAGTASGKAGGAAFISFYKMLLGI